MQHTLHCSIAVTAAIMAVGTILFLAGGKWILLMFGGTEEMLDMGVQGLPHYMRGIYLFRAGRDYRRRF